LRPIATSNPAPHRRRPPWLRAEKLRPPAPRRGRRPANATPSAPTPAAIVRLAVRDRLGGLVHECARRVMRTGFGTQAGRSGLRCFFPLTATATERTISSHLVRKPYNNPAAARQLRGRHDDG